jgi:putative acetyltransferase
VKISRADFDDLGLATFLEAHLDDIAPTAPPESRHALDLSELRQPHVRMWVATDDHRIVGTAALAALTGGAEQGHEELKSMRTDPCVRGRGIASGLLAHVLADARSRGLRRVSLETGSMEFFVPARTLYAKAGFEPCVPFGSYVDDPMSTFMTLDLTRARLTTVWA